MKGSNGSEYVQSGWVPKTYVEIINQSSTSTSPLADNKINDTISPPLSMTSSTHHQQHGIQKAIAIYPYMASRDDEATISADETIKILEKPDMDWWKIETSTGLIGLVPASYLKEIHESSISPKKLKSKPPVIGPSPASKSNTTGINSIVDRHKDREGDIHGSNSSQHPMALSSTPNNPFASSVSTSQGTHQIGSSGSATNSNPFLNMASSSPGMGSNPFLASGSPVLGKSAIEVKNMVYIVFFTFFGILFFFHFLSSCSFAVYTDSLLFPTTKNKKKKKRW